MISNVSNMVTAAVVVSAADNTSARQEETAKSYAGSQANTSTAPQTSTETAPVQAAAYGEEAANNNKEQEKEQQNQQDKPMDEHFVSEMTRELNELMSKLNCDLEFKYHKEVDVMSVKMVDKNTKEVIKEFPPEEMVEGMIKAQKWLGAFLDKKV
ncbi:MAG: flagellar protein FlaG [Anaerovibrio sp.]|nr:flagellar protein FlaG [Selenomonadaceae bacterium]MDY6053738.1 flagellar protein FlaG [Anaerovibrio sp.]